MNKKTNIMTAVNIVTIAAIFVLNYFYQKNGFDFTLKCICSAGFALLGIVNLTYALISRAGERRYYFAMAAGLILAMLGDVLIGYSFIVGAGTFALGHICFVIAYCFLQRVRLLDAVIGAVLFAGAGAFLLFCPLLEFEVPVFKAVCVVYAFIISAMLGKAIGNFIGKRDLFYGILALGSLLFFFSDLMLVFDWFIGTFDWTSEACMGTYYPALCLLALSMHVRAVYKEK